MLRSSFAGRGREMRDEATLQQGRDASLEGEMTCAKNLAIELGKQLAELRVQEQQAIEELKKVKEDRDGALKRLKK